MATLFTIVGCSDDSETTFSGADSNVFLIVETLDAGPEAFDTVAVGTVLAGVSFLVATLRTLECDPFLADG